jgi:serine-aspartate repeat-containing protein C/D/E
MSAGRQLVGIFGSLRDLCFGPTEFCVTEARTRTIQGSVSAKRRARRCQIEELEARRLMAADLVPQVMLGSVYFEEATGDDSKPDIIQVSFVGGAAGTTLNRVTINGDKRQDGLSEGDVFFDTAAGGLGAFDFEGLTIVSANGFTINGVTVVDGGSQIVFDLTGFDAGEKIVLSIDADEAQYVSGSDVDANSLVEGAEFQRSIVVGEFTAPHYVPLTLTGTYWDAYDDEFLAAHNVTGLTLDLPNDRYSPDHDYTDRTAGAVAYAAQIPLASLSGWVYHDQNDNGVFAHGTEQGIGGVTLELLDASGNPTGITTITSTAPGKVGYYEFLDLYPGTYGVREVQPAGWLDGKDAAGDHGGAAASEAAGRIDKIFGAILNFGDHAVEYNFGELLPGSISGRVHADHHEDCNFDEPEILLEGVRIDLLDANGNLITFTLTDANGEYHFTGLRPAIYQVREHNPTGYYDGGERVGSVGGVASDIGETYSMFTAIALGSGVDAVRYDFCEKVGVTLSGNVYHDRDDDGNFDRPGEEGIGSVVLKLLDASGNDTGLRATTNSAGYYEFTNLRKGTYTVVEVHPVAWLDGKDTPGNLGGVADVSPPGDKISQITINWGDTGIEYNFGELLPGSIAGVVVICDDDAAGGEVDIPLPGVRVDLLNAQGQVVATTTTNQHGEYSFTGLRPGIYTVREIQPTGYYDDEAHIGSGNGTVENPSLISHIDIGSGQQLVDYEFCELPPGSIAGRVIAHSGPECDFDHPQILLAGVQIDLLDGSGNLIATTFTDAKGEYSFTSLPPGTYRVYEHQPDGYFDGEERIGSIGGALIANDTIGNIVLAAAVDGIQYDFCEELPASIAGRVQAHTDEECDFDHPEILLEGVTIELRDSAGNLVATTTTDANGEYRFDGLQAGDYQVHELQPAGYYDGEERAGTAGGQLDGIDTIYDIHLDPGMHATQYDFCEHVGVMLSGNVYHDRDDDGNFDRDTEQGIGGVLVKLLDASGNDTGLRATTNAQGFYKFNDLAAGKYTVVEIHPSGWLDGKDTPGNLGGVADVSPPGDKISQIMINWGQMGTEYNFGELLPALISGRIHADGGPDCDFDHPHNMLEDVQVDLLDGQGNIVGVTFTDELGYYEFTGLRPGTYSVREHQPVAYFDGGERVGSVGGSSSDVAGFYSLFTGITLGSGVNAINYDFCEKPGAELSGYVFIDGAPIFTKDPLTPEQIAALRDGQRTSDDTPLRGVVLELRQGQTGAPVLIGTALPGSYSGAATDPIRVTTDANGYYHFGGLHAGLYAVVEIHPANVIDNVDTPGTLGGFAVNPVGLSTNGGIPTPTQEAIIEQFRAGFGTDVIIAIPLQYGEHAQENNFSEVTTIVGPPPPPPPPEPPKVPPKPPVFGAPGVPPIEPLVFLTPGIARPPFVFNNSRVLGYTWHLSVVNAGWPRSMTPDDVKFQLTAAQIDVAGWKNMPMDSARWTLATVDGNNVVVLRDEAFGNAKSVPVTGDFNGDGVTDIGVFIDGQWFLDLNGNGQWDEGDLWAQLGTQEDRPVTGDWDADGKTDIGIYGPAWSRDPWAVEREPGLPDADNFPTKPVGKMKNMPPTVEDATSGARILKRSAKGKNRADLIDHVFHYGNGTDVPVTGDWNGDGIRQIGTFRDGKWVLDTDGDGRFTEIDAQVTFGQAGDKPVVGDFNGDGVEEVGVYRAGTWVLDTNGNRHIDAQDKVFELGAAGDEPVVGDWNDDGTDDPGVFKPGQATDRITRRAS